MSSWWGKQKATYFGNATAIKEYRVQLRSTKSAWMLFLYVGILVLVALTSYAAIAGRSGDGSVSMAGFQQSLSGFYFAVLGIITTAILALAPVLAASPIVAEYDRRSMDIVLATPITPKYFLLGKYLGACRQLILLLFLSLPITAVGVAFGGSTWQEFLEQYLSFFLQGALAMAIATIVAVSTKKVATTVFVTYANLFAISMIGSITGITAFFGPSTPTPSGAQIGPFYGLLLPYSGALTVGSVTLVNSIEVPNWIFAIILAALGVKLCLLGAGSVLSKDGAVEIKSLRIHGVVSLAVLSSLFGFLLAPMILGPMTAGLGGPGGPSIAPSGIFFTLAFPMAAAVFFCVSTTSCFGLIDERKTREDGLFNIRRTFTGRPSSGLPYLFVLALAGSIPLWVVWGLYARGDWEVAAIHSVWFFVAVAFYWSCARLLSCGFLTAEAAKKSFTGILALLVFLVPAGLGVLDAAMISWIGSNWVPWSIRYPMIPGVELDLEMIKIFVLAILTVGLTYLGERIKRSKRERLGVI